MVKGCCAEAWQVRESDSGGIPAGAEPGHKLPSKDSGDPGHVVGGQEPRQPGWGTVAPSCLEECVPAPPMDAGVLSVCTMAFLTHIHLW